MLDDRDIIKSSYHRSFSFGCGERIVGGTSTENARLLTSFSPNLRPYAFLRPNQLTAIKAKLSVNDVVGRRPLELVVVAPDEFAGFQVEHLESDLDVSLLQPGAATVAVQRPDSAY